MISQFLDCNFNPSKNVTVLYSGQVKNEILPLITSVNSGRTPYPLGTFAPYMNASYSIYGIIGDCKV